MSSFLRAHTNTKVGVDAACAAVVRNHVFEQALVAVRSETHPDRELLRLGLPDLLFQRFEAMEIETERYGLPGQPARARGGKRAGSKTHRPHDLGVQEGRDTGRVVLAFLRYWPEMRSSREPAAVPSGNHMWRLFPLPLHRVPASWQSPAPVQHPACLSKVPTASLDCKVCRTSRSCITSIGMCMICSVWHMRGLLKGA